MLKETRSFQSAIRLFACVALFMHRDAGRSDHDALSSDM